MKHDNLDDCAARTIRREHFGNIIPASKQEALKEIYLLSGADISGSLYADSLNIIGGQVAVQQAAVVKNSLRISLACEGLVHFGSSLAVGKSILIEPNAQKNYVRVNGNLICDNGNLSHVIVYGDVFCREIIMNDCAILGAVYANEKLECSQSLLGTFFAGEAILEHGTSIWLAEGLAWDRITLTASVRALAMTLPRNFAQLIHKNQFLEDDQVILLSGKDIKNISIVDDKKDGEKTIKYIGLAHKKYNIAETEESIMLNSLLMGQYLDALSGKNGKDEEKMRQLETQIWKYLEELKDQEPTIPSA